MTNNEKLYQLLADIFEVETNEINDETSQDTLENWDSIHQMNLVFALEETFEIQLSFQETVELSSVPQIKEILKAKNIQFQ
jgi:acyl carrier protein